MQPWMRSLSDRQRSEMVGSSEKDVSRARFNARNRGLGPVAYTPRPDLVFSTYSYDPNAFDAAQPLLAKSAAATGDAAFVIISSISAAQADRADSYGPIKAALIHMAKGLARQHAKAGIRVNVVSPGMVFFEGGVWDTVKKNAPDFFAQANARNPTGRCATPQEIANAAVFLASPLSSYTTGSNLIVDGAVSSRVNF
jgi:3-oxoacyl-[acyl-carrier protein] reductase